MKLRFLMLALLAALALPFELAAQQRGGDPGRRHLHEVDRGPVENLLRNREALRLSEEQVVRIREIGVRLDEQNRPYVQRLMALRREVKAKLEAQPDLAREEREAMVRTSFEAARPSLEQIHQNNRAAMRELGALLAPEQKSTLKEILNRGRDRDGNSGDRNGRRERGH